MLFSYENRPFIWYMCENTAYTSSDWRQRHTDILSSQFRHPPYRTNLAISRVIDLIFTLFFALMAMARLSNHPATTERNDPAGLSPTQFSLAGPVARHMLLTL